MLSVQQAQADYAANCDYDVASDAAKARRFLVAVRVLLAMRPSMATRGGVGGNNSMTFDAPSLRRAEESVTRWLQLRQIDVGEAYADMRGIRE